MANKIFQINSCLSNRITYIAKRYSAERLAYFLWKGRMNAAKALLKNLYDEVYGIICADLPPIFLNDIYQCRMAFSNCYFCRGYVMAEALKSGYLLSCNQVSPVIGAHFCLDS